MKKKLFFAGAGGQGALAIGQMIAKAAMEETKKRNFVPTQTDETMIDEVEQVYCLDRDDEDVQK